MWMLDPSNAVERDHPLVSGAAVWLHGVTGGVGRKMNIIGDRFHANLINAASWVGSPVGHSLTLNSASSQYASFVGAIGPTMWSGATFQAVVRTRSSLSGFQNPFLGGNSLGLAISGAPSRDAAYFWNGAGEDYNFATGFTYTIGQWMYHAAVIRPDRATVYLGNIDTGRFQSATRVATHNSQSGGNSTTWFIGSDRTVGGRYLNGEITDCKISPNVFLADDQVYETFSQVRRGYRTPDSPLRWIMGTSYFTPMGGGPSPMAGTYLPGFAGIAPGW